MQIKKTANYGVRLYSIFDSKLDVHGGNPNIKKNCSAKLIELKKISRLMLNMESKKCKA